MKSDSFGQWWNKQTDEKVGVVAAFGMLGRHLIDGMSEEDLRTLGTKFCDAHTPLAREWEKILRLSGPLPKSEEASELPRVIESKLGNVTITRLADGRLTLRNDPGDELIAAVKASCKGRARWNPRFRNWVFDQSALAQIVSSLEKLLPG